MKTIGILYHLRYSRDRQDATVYCRITVNGVRATLAKFPLSSQNRENESKFFRDEVYTYIRIKAKQWDLDKERIKTTDTQSQVYNEILVNFKSKLFHIARELSNNSPIVTAEKIKRIALGEDKLTYTFAEIAMMYLSEVKAVAEHREQTGKGRWSWGTYLAYHYKIDNFKLFLKENKLSDIACEAVTMGVINRFKSWNLLKGNGEVYVGKSSQSVRTCIVWAFERQYIAFNPLLGVKIRIPQINSLTHLENWEVERIENCMTFTERQQHVADSYLFSCYTGLGYIDILNINASNVEHHGSRPYLSGYRHKTSTEFFVPLHSKAMKLIEKYGDCNNLNFPVRSNAEMNRIIKDIADKVGIEKHLWYHTARKTFIDKYINEYALDRSVIILASGHRNESELNRYAKTNKKTVIKAFESIF